MNKLKKSKILFGLPIALISLEVFLGMVLGYFAALLLSPKVKSITLNVGKYKFHFHHWLICLAVLPLIIIFQFSPLPLQFSSGILGGFIFQGIICYSDWHRVVYKKT